MSTVATAPLGVWLEVDPEQIRRRLEQMFPGVTAWFGEYTGQWWAMVGWRLLEAATPDQLAEKIRAARAPRPAPRRYERTPYGSFSQLRTVPPPRSSSTRRGF